MMALAASATNMRRGFVGLSGMVQTALKEKSVFRADVCISREARRSDQAAVVDGDGVCLFAKRPECGRFIWPQAADGTV